MSRDILIPLAIACGNRFCESCRNYRGRCRVFGKRPTIVGGKAERLPECKEAELFAKGDWETRMRDALEAERAAKSDSEGK